MSVAGFSNMGCGFDRIENLLWRVCHGELDGYEAERVVVMIGTNNLSCNTDDEIIRGIAHPVAVIARHQPSAGVEVIGLLPRRGMEDRVSGVNTKLEEKILQNMASVDAAFGTKTEMFKRVFYPCVENDPAEVERVRALLGDRFVTEKPRMIAEDFAYYQLNVPGVFVFCGCMDEEHRSPLHADTFDFDERALITGLALFIGLTARKDKENGLV